MLLGCAYFTFLIFSLYYFFVHQAYITFKTSGEMYNSITFWAIVNSLHMDFKTVKHLSNSCKKLYHRNSGLVWNTPILKSYLVSCSKHSKIQTARFFLHCSPTYLPSLPRPHQILHVLLPEQLTVPQICAAHTLILPY